MSLHSSVSIRHADAVTGTDSLTEITNEGGADDGEKAAHIRMSKMVVKMARTCDGGSVSAMAEDAFAGMGNDEGKSVDGDG